MSRIPHGRMDSKAGDGNRVESAVTDGSQTITTVYIGSYYEQITTVDGGSSTTEWNKYYYAGAVRLAMQENSEEPYYLITDHLGSTSLVVDSLGQEVARQSYLPFGEEWGSSVTDLPTTFTYTGQREAAEIGLHYYIARWYDAGIGHFLQADTIVPGVGNPMAWNRYGYVYYNPLIYNDPDGHIALLTIAAIVGGVGLISGIVDAAIQHHNTGSVDLQQSATVALIGTGAATVVAGGLVATGIVTVTSIGTATAVTTTAATGATAAASNGLEDELHAAAQTGNMAQELVQRLAEVSTKNPNSNSVSIGFWNFGDGYTKLGVSKGYTYLDMPESLYKIFQNSTNIDFWRVNEQFLDDAIKAGKSFILSTPYQTIMKPENFSTGVYREVKYLLSKGFTYIVENGIEKLVLPK